MPSAIEEFLDAKGGPEILLELDTDGLRFGEFFNRVDIARATLSNRLSEAQDADLIEKEIAERETGPVEVYVLTPRGVTLRFQMDISGVTASYNFVQQAQQLFNEEVDALKEWVSEHDGELDDTSPELLQKMVEMGEWDGLDRWQWTETDE